VGKVPVIEYRRMSFVPHRFLVRLSHPCRYVKNIPDVDGDDLLELSDSCRIDNFASLDEKKNFADVRMAWNESGLAIQVTVTGKTEAPQCDPARPRFSDGLSLWIDTRGDRTSHRASRYCHQFHLLPNGGGSDRDEPVLLQSKINRAQQDAPHCDPADVPFRMTNVKRGYRLEAFFPVAVLNGFDPDEHSVLGFYYAVRDQELGEQVLSVGSEFPYSDDPSLWAALELIKP
jgi:hypothetical protein